MAEIWGAAIGAAAAIGTTVYSASQSGGTGGSSSNSQMGVPGMWGDRSSDLLWNNINGMNDASGGLPYFAADHGEWYQMDPEANFFRQLQMSIAKDPRYQANPDHVRSAVLGAFDTQAGAAGQYLNDIVGPQLTNQMTAAGMGRSGAVGEQIQRAGTSMALPLAQQRASFEANWPTMLNAMGQGNAGMYNMGMKMGDLPRAMKMDDITRRQNLMVQGLGMMGPLMGMQGFNTSGQQNMGFNGAMQLGQQMGGTAMMGYGMGQNAGWWGQPSSSAKAPSSYQGVPYNMNDAYSMYGGF